MNTLPATSLVDLDRDRYPVDPWQLIETQPSIIDRGVAETLFASANGYLGLRGSHPEGDAGHDRGTFLNGVHETFPIRHAESAYGLAEVGQTMLHVPDATTLTVYVDDEAFALTTADVRDYRRTLDMRSGIVRRSLVWLTATGTSVRIESEQLVSFAHRHVALLGITVTPLDTDARVRIVSRTANQLASPHHGAADPSADDPRRSERLAADTLVPAGHLLAAGRATLAYRTARSGMTLAVAVDHHVTTDGSFVRDDIVGEHEAVSTFGFRAKRGAPVGVEKIVAYHSSNDAAPAELIERCVRTLDGVSNIGAEGLRAEQRVFLDAFWSRSDVEIDGQDDVQQAARWCLFQLAQAAARADGRGVPAKGVTGSGYSGHYFWDTEIYVLPFLSYTSPLWARNALRQRYSALPKARRRAADLNEAGALFPWRTINGDEASAYYAAGTAQYHINADIVFAIAKYVRATNDLAFLDREGTEIAVETARLWATLGFWRDVPDGGSTFHIHGVTGPDEYTTVVNDNLYTNVMARFNLRYAAEVVRDLARRDPAGYARVARKLSLSADEPDEWERAADAMHLPFSDSLGIHPQDAVFLEREIWDLENTPASQRPLLLHFHPLVIYRYQVLKQADVVLALFLQGDHFTADQKHADFDYYDPLTTGDSTLSAVVQSILAAEVGYADLALDYFRRAAFVDLADLHHNTSDGVHVASAGGVWTALVSGFGGMRDYSGDLSFDPRLPRSWNRLRFRMRWHETQIDVTITADELRVDAGPGQRVEFSVRGVGHSVEPGGSVVVALDGQGANRGEPSAARTAPRREDGTAITAGLPAVHDGEQLVPAPSN